MTAQTRNSKYPLLLGIRAFDLACKYGWKPKATNWNQSFIQALENRSGGGTGHYDWFIIIDDLPEEDRVDIADTLEQALNEIPDECIQIDHSDVPWFPMSSSRYGKSLFYKLVFWSEHKADLKEFIQLLRQGANQLSQPEEASQQ